MATVELNCDSPVRTCHAHVAVSGRYTALRFSLSDALHMFCRGSATRESEQANSQGVGRNQQPSSIADYDDASLGLSEDEDDMDDEDAML